jgi:hypothetical protein
MEHLYFYCLWLLYDFLFLKNDVNVPSKSLSAKKLEIFFVGVLKVAEEKSRIRSPIRICFSDIDPRIRIRTKMSRIRNLKHFPSVYPYS